MPPIVSFSIPRSHLVNLVRNTITRTRAPRKPSVAIAASAGDPGPRYFSREVRFGQHFFSKRITGAWDHGCELFVMTTGYQEYHLGDGSPDRPFLTEAPEFFVEHGNRYFDITADLTKSVGGDGQST
jgi:hypothetical protein